MTDGPSTFPIKQGDLEPVLECALLFSDGSPCDLTGATVVFSMRDAAGTLKITNQACLVVPAFSLVAISRTGAIATVTTGGVHQYEVGQRVLHVGADQPEYNGTFEILSAPTPDTYTIAVAGTPGVLSGGATASRSLVDYAWKGSETDTPGVYRGVFRATLASGQNISFPSDGNVLINVEAP